MGQGLRPAAFVPQGFVVDSVDREGETMLVTVHSSALERACPSCG